MVVVLFSPGGVNQSGHEDAPGKSDVSSNGRRMREALKHNTVWWQFDFLKPGQVAGRKQLRGYDA